MDAINPWLDPAEVRHLAEQLLRPVAPDRLKSGDPGFDQSFVGFMVPTPPQEEPRALVKIASLGQAPAADETPPVVHHQPQPTTSPEVAPAQTLRSAEPAPTPPPPSRSRFLERIHIFRDWLAKNFSAREIFILDREGEVIFDESGHGRLHFMARNLALTAPTSTRQNRHIHVKIGPGSILEVIPCETPYGRIVLGALVPESLPLQHVQTITQVLIQTALPA